MFKSDIFQEYAKTMVSNGLVKEAAEDDGKNKTEKKPIDLDTLRNLYHQNPNSEDEEKNLIEIAHPETAIVGRAYDAMNAVVENEQERHNVMVWLALKHPSGHLTHQRYVKSKSDLMNSLVQVAFKADSENDEEIMKLADNCASQLHKKALAPLALLGYSAVALGLGFLGWTTYGGVSVQNVYANAKLLMDQLADVADKPYAKVLMQTCVKLMKDASDFNDIRIRSVAGPLHSVDDLIDKATSNNSQKDIDRLVSIVKIWDAFLQVYPAYVEAVKMSMGTGKNEETADWIQKLKDISQTLVPSLNEEQQILDYLDGLKNSVIEAKKQANEMRMAGERKAEQLKPLIEEKIEEKKNSNIPNLEDLVKEFESNVPKV